MKCGKIHTLEIFKIQHIRQKTSIFTSLPARSYALKFQTHVFIYRGEGACAFRCKPTWVYKLDGSLNPGLWHTEHYVSVFVPQNGE